jgi:hypothetical protein
MRTRALLVCGGRSYDDLGQVHALLDRLLEDAPGLRLIHGGGRGADSLADAWAALRGVPCDVYPADWSKGRRAGPLRNEQMLERLRTETSPLVVAFPGGAGTADMVRRATAAGIRVVQVLGTPPAQEALRVFTTRGLMP